MTAPAVPRPDYRMLGTIFQVPGEEGLHLSNAMGRKKPSPPALTKSEDSSVRSKWTSDA